MTACTLHTSRLTRDHLNKNTTILDKEQDPRRLLYLEAIYIAIKQATINTQTDDFKLFRRGQVQGIQTFPSFPAGLGSPERRQSLSHSPTDVVMDPVPEECYFSWKFNCQAKKEKLKPVKAVRIRNLIQCSKIYGDEKHFELQESLDDNNEMILKCHKSCVSCYTSKVHIERHKRKRGAEPDSNVPFKVARRSHSGGSAECFDFKRHSFFCGEFCNLNADKKHPSRWREAYLVREMGHQGISLDVCGK
ncbi:hypothetical protein GWK47_024178 [Chionoecetes opilio]|uniref:Uncharacterized protein n=1 Tax=Chionoecetes opilio TaxID=41210 RepID=A0A8J5CDX3_CHIOP|nr:hypothetical protein GWK47_024178 [Chionoecetes opilio]